MKYNLTSNKVTIKITAQEPLVNVNLSFSREEVEYSGLNLNTEAKEFNYVSDDNMGIEIGDVLAIETIDSAEIEIV